MRISQDIRDRFGDATEQAVVAGMQHKSAEFRAAGGTVYLETPAIPSP